MQNDLISIAEFSHAVGSIYDCAIDPKRWPEALREICGAANCAAGMIMVHDLEQKSTRLTESWNYESNWLKRGEMYGGEITRFWDRVPNLHSRSLDEPLTALRDLPPDTLDNSRFFHEWVRPQGFIDAVQLVVMRRPHRIGALGMSRHESVGTVTERDLAVVRELAPHIRRAVAISDILDERTITIETFEASLNAIQIGIVLVDRDALIVHANRTAEGMLKARTPIRSEQGEIRANLPEVSAALRSAITAAAGDETAMGRLGVGIPASSTDGDPALIHVLPLTGGEVRARMARRAAAALFITTRIDDLGTPPEALANLFGLTAAESRLLAGLLDGDSLADAARKLEIAITTARTHLAHIFDKTGTSRQTDLIRLAARFSLPIGHPS